MREVATHCPYCALRCATVLRSGLDGRVEVEAGASGWHQKASTAAALLDHPDRLATPLIAGRPATWDEACPLIVSKILDIRSTRERDTVAVFGGGGLTNEKCKFARVALCTKHIDDDRRLFRMADLSKVADFVRPETAELADVVLPVTQWAEEDGTMTNLEGRVQLRLALRKPPPETGTDLAVIAEPASRLGNGSTGARFDSDPRAVFEELRRATAGGVADNAGVTWERVDAEGGVFWPCPAADRAGTPRLFTTSFPASDGRARTVAVDQLPDVGRRLVVTRCGMKVAVP